MKPNRTSAAVAGLLELGDLAFILKKGMDVRPLRPILEKYQMMHQALEIAITGANYDDEWDVKIDKEEFQNLVHAYNFDPLSP